MQVKGKIVKQQVRDLSGAALVARIRAEMAEEGLEPDAREAEMLVLAADLQDRVLELEGSIGDDGLTSMSKGGIVRLHPAVAEVRQTRAALARVLAGIQMRDEVKNPAKQKAADTRWRSHNIAKRSISG